ncbi:SMC-Scp complex subunit ScpB [Candidatus Woesearchaeota archaeon]|nr:SMC-Scp complex subunit ScpB [Candidatus Woesearchaeota archaeon]
MAELKKQSIKNKVEAVLFSTGHRITLDDISRLCRAQKEYVLASLQELQKEYDEKQSSLMLVEEGDFWKLTVRDHLISIVRKIVTETELTKSVLETLAVIAFKYPILQSDLIKIRTNKAYDHLVELEKSGYISRQKRSRTNLIKLTEKFFRYFDLTEDKLKDQFKDFDSIAKAINEKEEEVEKIKEQQRKRAEELKKEDEKIRKEIESLDESGEEFEVPLETYEAKQKEDVSEEFEQKGNLFVEKEKIGDMEVFEETQQRKSKKEQTQAKEKGAIFQDTLQPAKGQIQTEENLESKQIFEDKEKTEAKKQKRKSEGINLSPEMEARVDEKVEEMLHGQESKEENNGV